MIRIAVVDDNYCFIAEITKMIKTYFSDIEYEQDDFTNGLEFVESLNNSLMYDIVFMDLEMDIMNGEVAIQKLREYDINEKTYVIFVSSHTDNLYSLFSLHPFDYLIKPLDYGKMSGVLNKIMNQILYERKYISLVVNRKEINICISEIMYIQSTAHKVKLVLCSSDAELYSYTKIEDIYTMLKEQSEDFFRPHTSFLVNRRYVTGYLKDYVLINDKEIPISRKFRDEMMINVHKEV